MKPGGGGMVAICVDADSWPRLHPTDYVRTSFRHKFDRCCQVVVLGHGIQVPECTCPQFRMEPIVALLYVTRMFEGRN